MMLRRVPHFVAICIALCINIVPTLSQTNSRTFLGEGSFALLSPWLGFSSNEGTLTFDIRTSELNGLLLYAEGNETQSPDGPSDYIVVSMDNGVIQVVLQFFENQSNSLNSTNVSLGEHLNDNQLHSFSIRRSGQTVEYILDSVERAAIDYANPVTTNIGENGVYFGGLPNTFTPILEGVENEATFVGCLESFMASNNSDPVADVEILDQNNVREGCMDPCSAVSCQPGVCIPRWPDRGFCDCSGTSMSGESCSEDPPSIQFVGDSYFCYKLVPQPFINTSNTINVQLIAPLPTSGTVMTGLSESGERFAIYLYNSTLTYELSIGNETLLSISSETPLSVNSSYQVELVRSSNRVDVTVQELSVPQRVESFGRVLTGALSSEAVVFQSVCVGGGLLDVQNYLGEQRSIFFNHFALSEERNFIEFEQTCISRTDLVHISPLLTPLSLKLEKQTLQNRRISFNFRTQRERGAALLLVENDQFELTITLGGEGNIFSLANEIGTRNFAFQPCEFAPLNDEQWHHLSIERMESEFVYTVDQNSMATCTYDPTNNLPGVLAALENEPLQIAATFTQVGLGGTLVPYDGCVSNIEIRKDLDSEPFRPNLEVAINAEERFDRTGCDTNCTMIEQIVTNCPGECRCFKGGFVPTCACPGDGNSCSSIGSPVTTPSSSSSSSPTTGTTAATPDDTQTTLPEITPPEDTPTTSTTAGTTTTDNNITTVILPPPVGGALSTGEVVGIAVGATLGVLLLVAIVGLLLFCLYRSLASKQGFYKTHETNGKEVSMLHYSASLRELSSEVVTVESNGTVGVARANSHDKEFYL